MPPRCFTWVVIILLLGSTASASDGSSAASPSTSPSDALARARTALAELDPLRALHAVEDGLKSAPEDRALRALAAALLRGIDPDRARRLRQLAGPVPSPLPTLPPKNPIAGPGKAYVNVASAIVRGSASVNGAIIGKLAIGNSVDVQSLHNDFAHVAFNGRRGFVHRDLLSTTLPTIEELLAEAKTASEISPDHELTLLWRALHLSPSIELVERCVTLAIATKRYALSIAGMELALQRGVRHPRHGVPSESWENLRHHLYREVVARNPGPILSAVQPPWPGTPVPAPRELPRIEFNDLYSAILADRTSPIWTGLQRTLASPPNLQPVARYFHVMPYTIFLMPLDGWRVQSLHIGSGAEDACVAPEAVTVRMKPAPAAPEVGWLRPTTRVMRLTATRPWVLVRAGVYNEVFGYVRASDLVTRCENSAAVLSPPPSAEAPIYFATGGTLFARWKPGSAQIEPLLDPPKGLTQNLQPFALMPWFADTGDDHGVTAFPRPAYVPPWKNDDVGGGHAPGHIRLGSPGNANFFATAPVRRVELETIREEGSPDEFAEGRYVQLRKMKNGPFYLHLREGGGKRCWGHSTRAEDVQLTTCSERRVDEGQHVPPDHPADHWLKLDVGPGYILQVSPDDGPAENGGTREGIRLKIHDISGAPLGGIQLHLKTQWGA